MAEQGSDGEGEEGGPDALTDALKRLDDETSCAICHERYRDPKLLPACGHYFCCDCVNDHVNYSKSKPVGCPICARDITLPKDGAEALPTAFFVANMLDVLSVIDAKKQDLLKREITCDLCHKDKAESYCRKCKQFLCTECSQTHLTMAHFAQHKLMSLDELKQWRERGRSVRSDSILSRATIARSDSIMSTMSVRSEGGRHRNKMMCVKHDDPIKVYCFKCERLICRDCTLYDHRDHQTALIKECAPSTRQGLQAALRPLEKGRDNIMASQQEMEHIENQVSEQETALFETTRESFHKMRQHMDTCEAAMLQTLKLVAQGKRDALSGHKKALDVALNEVSLTLDSVTTEVNGATNEDIMSQFQMLHQQIEKRMARHQMLSLEPPTVADMVCSPPTPDSFPMEIGLVFAESHLRYLNVTPPQFASVGEPVLYHIKVPHSLGGLLEVELHSQVDPACVVKAEVTHMSEKVNHGLVFDEYRVDFTPRLRGRHVVKVKINGREIPSSPFKIFVRIDPTFLGFPIRISEPMGKACGITLTPNGEIAVTENMWKNITFMKRDLKTKTLVVRNEQFKFPRGIAVAEDGTYFTSDKGQGHNQNAKEYTLMKYDGKNMIKGIKHGSLGVSLIRIIKNRLYACDRKLGQVHVFSLDLEFMFTFSTSKTPEPHDIIEHNGNLYVVGAADKGSVVGIFDFEGKFLGHAPLRGVPLVALRGICFDQRDNMFVTMGRVGKESHGHEGIYVFKKNGELITSFGRGIVDYPLAITIDTDGFVYVTNHTKVGNGVFVF